LDEFIEKEEQKSQPFDGLVGALAVMMPSMNVYVQHPVMNCNLPLCVVITDLNDHCKWSRERIADWLDKLHDDGLDLSFTEKENEDEQD
jgi:hypothetical protein